MVQIDSSENSLAGGFENIEEDIRSINNNAYMCREHANSEFEKFCSTCF